MSEGQSDHAGKATERWPRRSRLHRSVVLAFGSLAGFVMSMREPPHAYGSFHLAALFCVIAGIAAATVSSEPMTALLKVLSFFLLFLYGATGARLITLGREIAVVRG